MGTFAEILILIGTISALGYFARGYYLLFSHINLAKLLSFLMAFKLAHASVNNFFDRIPMGRIMNRFIRDLGLMDWALPFATHWLYIVASLCIIDFIAATYAGSYIMIFFIVAYFYISIKIQRHYMHLYREATRLKSISASPMIQCFSESMQGLSTIRAYRKEELYVNKYLDAVDEFQKNCIVTDALMRWFVLRLVLFSTMLLLPSIVLNIYYVQSGPGIFAMLMKYMVVIMNDINETLDTVSNQENRMISFERCVYFANIEPE